MNWAKIVTHLFILPENIDVMAQRPPKGLKV